MHAARRAVIDVGTNSVKVLVADVSAGVVQPVLEESRQTRLGHGFYDTRRLQPEAIAKTAVAVAEFADAARNLNAQHIRVIATSAARDAMNPGELTDAIERASRLKTEIISGEQEADWAYRGVASDPKLANQPLLILDVGGGSTELILGHGTHNDFSHSFPLGAVRLLELFPVSDPPSKTEFAEVSKWLADFARRQVRPKIRAELYYEGKFSQVRLVSTGGSASILARMELEMTGFDRDRIESVRLSRTKVRARLDHLWTLTLAQRQNIAGLPRNRADVVLTGAAIYASVMEEFGFEELCFSTRGLRFAAVMAPG